MARSSASASDTVLLYVYNISTVISSFESFESSILCPIQFRSKSRLSRLTSRPRLIIRLLLYVLLIQNRYSQWRRRIAVAGMGMGPQIFSLRNALTRLVLINFELHAADFTLPTYSLLLLHTK